MEGALIFRAGEKDLREVCTSPQNLGMMDVLDKITCMLGSYFHYRNMLDGY
jgi:hypothetical protein